MFQNLPSYADLSVAGDWLPEVPTHWAWDPARTLFKERKETGYIDEPLLSVTIARGVIPQAELLASTSKKDSSNADKSKYKLVETGDLVYNKMRAWQGAAGLSRHRGIVSPAYVVMTARRGEAAYFHHLVRTHMFAKEAERWSYGITSDQWSLRPEHFKMIRFPVPPAEEQAAIVKYLAHANARIDAAIAAKRRLVALLDEQRLATAAQLISEVEGDRMRLKNVASLQTGLTLGKDYGDKDLNEYPYLRVANVQMGHVTTEDVATVRVPAEEAVRCTLRPGDVLMTEGGDIDKLGRGTVWDGAIDGCLHQNHVFAVRCQDRLLPEYLAAWLAAPEPRWYFYVTAKKTTNLAATNSTTVRGLPIVLPSLREQQAVLAEVAEATAPIASAVARSEREIQLLREFRTRLVAEVVTGRVDVRAVAAALPEVESAAAWGDSGFPGDDEPAELDDMLVESEG